MANSKKSKTTKDKTTKPKKSDAKAAKAAKSEAKVAKSEPAGLAAERKAELLALPKEYGRPIDVPVAQTLQESRELEEVCKLYGADLIAKSELAADTRDTLKLRRAVLEQAENVWFGYRLAITPEEKRQARQDSEALKRDLVAALRFFLRKDHDVQRKVSAIQEGSGLADLLDDLSKLADLTEEHLGALVKADYPQQMSAAEAASKARSFAEALGATVAAEKANQDAEEAINLRNRAFWNLRELMDDVRASGRYVFRKKPKLLVLFRSSKTDSHTKEKPTTSPGATPTEAR